MIQPTHNTAGMPKGTSPARSNPLVLVPAVRRNAATADHDDDQPDAGDVVSQSRATATPKPKAAKRPKLTKLTKLTKDDCNNVTAQAPGSQNNTNMQNAPAITATQTTFKIHLKAGTVAPDQTKKNQLGMAVTFYNYAHSKPAVGNNNDEDVTMQDAPATAATKVVNGPISLEACFAGIKTTGKCILCILIAFN